MVNTLRSRTSVRSETGAVVPMRVYVVQQQTLMAKALCQVLEQDPTIVIVGSAAAVDPERLRTARPTLILLDSEASLEVLASTMETCRKVCKDARIGVLSEHLNPEVMQRALSVGADGYLVKDISLEELVAAVKAIGTGGFYADPRLVGQVLRKHAGASRRDPSELSPRESDVVRLIAAGLSNREIGSKLCLSDKTVKNHISRIFTKLNVNARTQVVIYAIRSGLA